MATAMLAQAMSSLSIRPCRALQAQRLSSKHNGLCAAPRLTATLRHQQVQRAPAALEVEATSKNKLKTRKAAAKRYHITGSGKVMRRKPGKQHINEKYSPSHLKRLGKMAQVDDRNLTNIIGCLPYSKLSK